MDDAYYDFAVEHSEIVDDIRILKPEALIVLKAVAYLENLRRKEEGLRLTGKTSTSIRKMFTGWHTYLTAASGLR